MAPSANTIHHKYDVFLSFKGQDTSKFFVENLNRSLRQKDILTFKYDDELIEGEDITDRLSEAVEESSFSIVIFSTIYGSSSWCFDELVQIVQCKRTNGHVICPVFYHVEPTEVRKREGKFGNGFAKVASTNEGKVEKWIDALSEAAIRKDGFIRA